jgi:hypothetical protein
MIKFWFDRYRVNRPSHRIRARLPAEELQRQGYNSAVVSDLNQVTAGDMVIITKDSRPESLHNLRARGAVVGFDLCDNKFDEPEEGDLYRLMCREADFVTANTPTMQQVVKHHTGLDSMLYIDPVDHPRGEARARPNNIPLKMVWYGGRSSIKYVGWESVMRDLHKLTVPWELTVICDRVNKVQPGFSRDCLDPASRVKFQEWSWDMQQQCVDECDIVLIPITNGDDRTRRRTVTKSHNRLVDAISQGRWVISSSIPSYEILANYCWLGDVLRGVRFYLEQPQRVVERIQQGQQWIQENASVQVAAGQLIDIYNKTRK